MHTLLLSSKELSITGDVLIDSQLQSLGNSWFWEDFVIVPWCTAFSNKKRHMMSGLECLESNSDQASEDTKSEANISDECFPSISSSMLKRIIRSFFKRVHVRCSAGFSLYICVAVIFWCADQSEQALSWFLPALIGSYFIWLYRRQSSLCFCSDMNTKGNAFITYSHSGIIIIRFCTSFTVYSQGI